MNGTTRRSLAATAAIALVLLVGMSAPAIAAATPMNVYRFYNVRAGAHFYTTSDSEMTSVRRDFAGTLNYEGISYTLDSASAAATQDLYRFFNTKTGVHFYTASDAERDNLMATQAATYRYEGVAYKVSPTPADGAAAVYRFYNHRVGGVHFYTASAAERDSVIAGCASTYTYEGVAYYVPVTAAVAVPEPPATGEDALANTILDGLKAQYPRYLDGTTVIFGDAHGYQAVCYFSVGRIVVSPTHTATLQRILSHEIWHIIDWRDNNRIDWGESVPPADYSSYQG